MSPEVKFPIAGLVLAVTLFALAVQIGSPWLPILVFGASVLSMHQAEAEFGPGGAVIILVSLMLLQNPIFGLGAGPEHYGPIRQSIAVITFVNPLFLVAKNLFASNFSRSELAQQSPIRATGLLLAFLVLHLLLFGGGLQSSLAGMRNILAAPMLAMVGYSAVAAGAETGWILRNLMRLASSLALIALLDFALNRDFVWLRLFNIEELMAVRDIRRSAYSSYTVPGDFYTRFAGRTFIRPTSLTGSGVLLGYVSVYAIILNLDHRSRSKYCYALLPFLAAIALAGIVKGALLLLAVTLALVVLRPRRNAPSRVQTVLTTVIVVLGGLGLISGFTSGDSYHIAGLREPLRQGLGRLVTGNGLGAGGVNARLSGGLEVVGASSGAESGVGALIFQVGLVGASLWFIAMFGLASALRLRDNPMPHALVFGVIAPSFLQESIMSPAVVALPMIAAGTYLLAPRKERNDVASHNAVSQ